MPLNNDQTVFLGDHEIENLLGAWGKGDTPSNRERLSAEAKKFRDDPDWGPHTWERFYQYVDVKNVKRLLTDKAGTVKRIDDHLGSGYTIVDGWGSPQPKKPAPPERKAEPALTVEPKVQPTATPSTFIFEPEPVPPAPKPKEPTTVFSDATKPAPSPPKKETVPPSFSSVTPPQSPKSTEPPIQPKEPAPVLHEQKPAPKPIEPAAPPPKKESVPPSFGYTKPPEKPATIAQGPTPITPPDKGLVTPPETGRQRPVEFTRTEPAPAAGTGTLVEEAPEKKRASFVPLLLVATILAAAAVIVLILLFAKPQAQTAISSPAPSETVSPAATASPAAVTPAERFTSAVADNTPVMFIGDQEFFLPGEERKLDNILAAARGLAKADLLVTGHTADNNLPEAQFVLSLERAQTVRDYLLKNPAGSVFTIRVRGRGALEPVVTGVPLSEQAANRRVEIKVKSAE